MNMSIRRPRALFTGLVSSFLGLFTLLALLGTQVGYAKAPSPSFVRVIHASPFVGTADVFLDGKKLLSSFAFGAITGYAAIPPGPHKVQIALVGKGIGAAALSQTLAVSPGVAYTVAATGATAKTLALKVFVDSNLITPGATKLRVYHLSPNVGSLDVTSNGNTIFQSITYLQASQYQALSVGSYTFDVNGTGGNAQLPISTTLKANTVTSIFVVGMLNGNPSLELVPAQVPGLPGLPQTGSDPYALPASSQPTTPWSSWLLSGALMLALVGTCMLFIRRRAHAN
jgi:Domain of unknown function (DUF4397)